MQKEVFIPQGGAKPLAPYSPGIALGDLIFTSGQIALDPASGKMIDGDVAAEARQVLENLGAVLKAAGSSFAQVLKCTVYMVDINDYAAINEVYGQYFTEDPPARSAVQVAALPAGARLEIEAIATRS